MCGGCGVVWVGDWEGGEGGGEGFEIWNGRTKQEMGEGFWKVLFGKICEHFSVKRVWIV